LTIPIDEATNVFMIYSHQGGELRALNSIQTGFGERNEYRKDKGGI
jgi:hypothetical protein